MNRNFSDELDKNNFNAFELVNVTAQVSRVINEQTKADKLKIKTKVTTEALAKVLDGRVVILKGEES